jgi:hypothetical protein
MARIILGSYMIRYPLGGVLSSSLQWLAGFQQLGHDVYLVEKSGWAGSCYDPVKNVMSDDCTYGVQAVKELLSRFGLEAKWCYVDASKRSSVRQICLSTEGRTGPGWRRPARPGCASLSMGNRRFVK